MKQALRIYEFNDSFHPKKQQILNSFIFSHWYKKLGLFITFLQCLLAFYEHTSVWWDKMDNNTNKLLTINIIEIFFILFHCINIFIRIYCKNSLSEIHWVLYFIAFMALFCNISLIISCFLNNYIRIHRIFRQ